MHSRAPAFLSLILLPTLCSASNNAQVYLHPPISSSSRSLSSDALLAQHLGLEAFETLSHEISHDEVVLGGAWNFVGQGARDALLISVDARHPEDVIPNDLKPSFALSASSHSASAALHRYSRIAPMAYSSVANPSSHLSATPARFLDIFSLSALSSEKPHSLPNFLGSLSALVAFVEEAPDYNAGGRFGAFELEGLRDIEEVWGRQSELYLTAVAGVKAALQSAISSDSLSLAVLCSTSSLHARQVVQPPQTPFPVPGVPDTAPIFSTSTCFTTADACANATSSCSSRGQCVGVTRAGRTCFVCECGKAPLEEGGKNVTWAGSMCQKKDISQQFTLIVGTVIFLIMMSVGSIALLYSIGDQELPGTLTGGVGHMKRD